jgi:hypothetical protein
MTTSVSSEDNLDWAGDTGAQSGGDPYVDSGFTSPSLSGITSLLTPFKGIFDRLKSGNTTANDINAALGVLGLIMPSLNKPQTAGWKGSIDMNKQFTRTPIAQPAYTPYAQSAAPVMGRQFFTSTYGAPPVATPAPAPAIPIPAPAIPEPTTPPLTEQGLDPNSPGDSGGMAEGGLAGFARGGKAMPPRYLRGETDGMEDKIRSSIDGVQPAKLSHGEFVIPADVVSHLGNGNSDAGAKVLYNMMDRVRKARTGTKKQGKQIRPEKFTPGGIAGYAGGGAVSFQTGGTAVGGAGATSSPLGTSTETNISSWAGPYVGDMLSKTAALTNAPYQAYQGPMVAGTAPLQSKVFSGLQSLNFPSQMGQSFSAQGAYQLPTMTSRGIMGEGYGGGQGLQPQGQQQPIQFAQQKPQGQYQQFDPNQDYGPRDMMYRGGPPTAQDMMFRSQREQDMRQMVGMATQGGAEQQPLKELQKQYDTRPYLPEPTPGVSSQQASPTGIASQYMNPYLSAVLTPQLEEMRRQSQITQMGTAGKLAQAGAFGGSRQAIMDAETQRNLLQEQSKAIGTGYANAYDKAMGQFNVEQGQAKTLADMMAGAGQQQRGIEQEGITALQKQYETEQLQPYTNLRFQKEMLQGLPVSTAATTANTSQLGQFSGNFADLVKNLEALGLKG